MSETEGASISWSTKDVVRMSDGPRKRSSSGSSGGGGDRGSLSEPLRAPSAGGKDAENSVVALKKQIGLGSACAIIIGKYIKVKVKVED